MPIKALLFDIGGVCVLSPMLAIRTYEQTHALPPGWINYAIQHNSPTGAWHRLERGEMRAGAEFYAQFEADFQRRDLWAAFLQKIGREEELPVPVIEGGELFNSMMEVSRTLDPDMFPVLKALKESGRFVVGALSNTSLAAEDEYIGPDTTTTTSPLHSMFDFFVSSAHTGLRKPEPEIYEVAWGEIKRVAGEKGIKDIRREEVLFLDDIGVNLKGGRQAGFRTVKVQLGRVREAVREVERETGLALVERGKL